MSLPVPLVVYLLGAVCVAMMFRGGMQEHRKTHDDSNIGPVAAGGIAVALMVFWPVIALTAIATGALWVIGRVLGGKP